MVVILQIPRENPVSGETVPLTTVAQINELEGLDASCPAYYYQFTLDKQ